MSIKSFVQHSGWQEMVSLCSLIRLIDVCADRDQPEFLCSRSDSRYFEVHVATAGGWLTRYGPREVRNSIYRYRKIHIDYRSKFLYRFISPISIIYGNTNSRLARVRMWIWHAPSQWPFPGIFEARNEVSWWLLTLLVSRSQEWAFFHVTFDVKRLLFGLVWKVVRCLSTKQDGGCARFFWSQVFASRHGSSSQWRAQQDEDSAGKSSSSSLVSGRLGSSWTR